MGWYIFAVCPQNKHWVICNLQGHLQGRKNFHLRFLLPFCEGQRPQGSGPSYSFHLEWLLGRGHLDGPPATFWLLYFTSCLKTEGKPTVWTLQKSLLTGGVLVKITQGQEKESATVRSANNGWYETTLCQSFSINLFCTGSILHWRFP